MSRSKAKKGARVDETPRGSTTEEAVMHEETDEKDSVIEEMQAAIEAMSARLDEQGAALDAAKAELAQQREAYDALAAQLADIHGAAATACATVEKLRGEVKRGVVSEAAVLTLEEYRKARDAGRSTFMLAADCRHTALTVRAGAEMRVVDYSQPLIEALISDGKLRLKAAV